MRILGAVVCTTWALFFAAQLLTHFLHQRLFGDSAIALGLFALAVVGVAASLRARVMLMWVVTIGWAVPAFYLAGSPTWIKYVGLIWLGYLLAMVWLSSRRGKTIAP